MKALATDKRDIFKTIVDNNSGISLSAARYLLKMKFSDEQVTRMKELSAKIEEGDVSASERSEIDNYENWGLFLDLLHAKARVALREKSRKNSE